MVREVFMGLSFRFWSVRFMGLRLWLARRPDTRMLLCGCQQQLCAWQRKSENRVGRSYAAGRECWAATLAGYLANAA